MSTVGGVSTVCRRRVNCMPVASQLHAGGVSTACRRRVNCMPAACQLYVGCMSDVCRLYVGCMSAVFPEYTCPLERLRCDAADGSLLPVFSLTSMHLWCLRTFDVSGVFGVDAPLMTSSCELEDDMEVMASRGAEPSLRGE